MSEHTETAIFAAGCFWGIEHAYRQIEGVLDAVSGYIGGHTANPTYREVCSGTTGHAEAVRVTFDPDSVSYETLLQTFWAIHDPTQVNRQGPDVGTQYRSEIFVTTAQQRSAAERSKAEEEASGRHARPIATGITEAGRFYEAESYHQRYFEKHGVRGCGLRH